MFSGCVAATSAGSLMGIALALWEWVPSTNALPGLEKSRFEVVTVLKFLGRLLGLSPQATCGTLGR